jgi:MFS transporter, OFA family, oxalate/formate antiporter
MELREVRNIGWRVTLAGIGINLALGVLYAWSVVKAKIPKNWDGYEWTDLKKNLPYAVACLVFALTMVPAGRAQDRYGPRWVALAGGIAVGVGMIIASFYTSCTGFVIGFGILAGAGIGMGYAAATPAAVKWFPPHRTGMIAGLVVAGFGLASVYISPLATHLISIYSVPMKNDINGMNTGPGVQMTMLILGIAFLVAVGFFSQLLRVPPAGWKPAAPAAAAKKPAAADFTWQQMLATPQFYLMWFMYLFAAGAGLMIIANLAPIVKDKTGSNAGFVLVALLAIGNAAGRIVAGTLSDIIGRRATMMIVFLFQAVVMFILPFDFTKQFWLLVVLSMLIGANYGANLALFPAATKDYFGLKNFGVNYGWVFTAWGVGAAVLALVSGKIKDVTGNYDLAYIIAGVGLVAAAILLLLVKPPAPLASAQPTPSDPLKEQPVAGMK